MPHPHSMEPELIRSQLHTVVAKLILGIMKFILHVYFYIRTDNNDTEIWAGDDYNGIHF